jgi:hypothetical protein
MHLSPLYPVVGFRVPEALAGDDNEVSLDQSGAQKVFEMITGTTLAVGIVAAAGYLYQRIAKAAGAEDNVEDLY